MKIKCLVSCSNSNGSPDFHQVIVEGTEDQISSGKHYEAAKDSAEECGYDAYLVYDEEDHSNLMSLYQWEQVEAVAI